MPDSVADVDVLAMGVLASWYSLLVQIIGALLMIAPVIVVAVQYARGEVHATELLDSIGSALAVVGTGGVLYWTHAPDAPATT